MCTKSRARPSETEDVYDNMNKMDGLFQVDAKDNFDFRQWTCEFYKCEPEEAEESKLFAKYEYSYIQRKVKVEYVTWYGK